jgi:DNA invertase Pin-like site-specific DNA recombinase
VRSAIAIERATGEDAKAVEALVPVAEYVRMSTDNQKYSIQNQSQAIRAYAQARGMSVIRTYSDAGKSGLSLSGRNGLKQLLEDAQAAEIGFRTILVYDVSRWGRFQDVDESAYYEYICRRAGIGVEYCAEQFENDGSSFATIIKNLKRAMAAEFSRELSVKVFAGISRIVELGFRPGGTAGYGYRRLLVDPGGEVKCVLAKGEQKCISTDRVKLVHGPPSEVDTVRWIFTTFVRRRKSEAQIATTLNKKGVPNGTGQRWTHAVINQLLRNEKYIGNNVWNQTSFKLKKRFVRNDPSMWIRADGSFEPIVDRSTFEAAQTILGRRPLFTCRGRRKGLSDEQMLKALRGLLRRHGYLSVALIERSSCVPSVALYAKRFGGLKQVYRLIDYSPGRWKKGVTPTGRPKGLSDAEMLDALRKLRDQFGYLTREIISTSKSVPALSAYYRRFGTLRRAYELIRFCPATAQQRAQKSRRYASDQALLHALRRLRQKHGRLSRKIIDGDAEAPARGTLVRRFGSLLRAYELASYTPELRQGDLHRSSFDFGSGG